MTNSKFLAIEQELNATYLERREAVRGLLVGLLAQQHVLFLGPPGTAKSALTEDLCSRIGGNYFRWLLSRTSAPEELFGPVSLKALEQDSYKRNTSNKLPEANIAFLDEIFKCNSAVLNGTLGILNERLFFNNGTPMQCPLEMTVGASNELPEDREELGALWDRFLLRYVVGYIRDPRNFENLLLGGGQVGRTTISQVELKIAQSEVIDVDIRKIIPRLAALRAEMVKMNVVVSDRRWRQSLTIIQANAWLEGRTQAVDDDMAILVHSLWSEPNQIAQVRQSIMSMANPYDSAAQDALDEALEIWQNAMNAPEEKSSAVGGEANAKLKKIAKKLTDLKEEAATKGKGTERIEEALAQTVAWNREVIAKCLGITL